jgi:uncharacterized protein (TIGR03663 family)
MNMKNKSQWLTLGLILTIVIAFVVRVYEIDLRPLHHDEGVNFHFLQETANRGYYPYSHENYHGPLYFYLSRLFLTLFGDNELGLRLSSIVSGLSLVALPFLALEGFGAGFVLLAGIFLAFSPSMVFHSRYAIHEMLFAALSIWFAIASFKWFLNRERQELYQMFLALALLIATKETFIISGAATVIGLLFVFSPVRLFSQLWAARKDYAAPFILFTIVLFGIFSGGFRWFGGIYEMFLAVPQWIGRGTGDTGHFKPFVFYSQVLWMTEPWLIVGLILGGILFGALLLPRFRKSRLGSALVGDSLLRFLFGLSLGFWFLYGVVSYKTVWLIISQSSAVTLFLARFIYLLISNQQISSRRYFAGLVPLLLATIGYYSYLYNFKNPYGLNHPYCYVHTTDGLLRMMSDIKDYRKRYPNARILVGVNSYWPLPFYFRDFGNGIAYQGDSRFEDFKDNYDIMILDSKENSAAAGWISKYNRLSAVQETNTYYRTK